MELAILSSRFGVRRLRGDCRGVSRAFARKKSAMSRFLDCDMAYPSHDGSVGRAEHLCEIWISRLETVKHMFHGLQHEDNSVELRVGVSRARVEMDHRD